MIATFFRKTESVPVILIENRKTVAVDQYCTVCLILKFLENCCVIDKSVDEQHAVARSHKAGKTLNFLYKSGIQLVIHSSQSPNLALNGLFLFSKIKNCYFASLDLKMQMDQLSIFVFFDRFTQIPQKKFLGQSQKPFEIMKNE